MAAKRLPPFAPAEKVERAIQFAHNAPDELTGMNWPLPMCNNSTAEPWLPPMVLFVLTVLGCAPALEK
jgi:hypothetical protein